MRLVRTLLAPALAAMAVAAVAGPASAQLTEDNVKDVIKCQDTIQKEGRKFVTAKTKAVENCIDNFVDAELRFEAGAITADEYQKAFDQAETQCRNHVQKIQNASRKFYDKVVKACQPVDSLVTGPDDVLGFQELITALNDEFGLGITVTSISDLAAALCVGTELLVDLGAVMYAPRLIVDPDLLLPATVLLGALDPVCLPPGGPALLN